MIPMNLFVRNNTYTNYDSFDIIWWEKFYQNQEWLKPASGQLNNTLHAFELGIQYSHTHTCICDVTDGTCVCGIHSVNSMVIFTQRIFYEFGTGSEHHFDNRHA